MNGLEKWIQQRSEVEIKTVLIGGGVLYFVILLGGFALALEHRSIEGGLLATAWAFVPRILCAALGVSED